MKTRQGDPLFDVRATLYSVSAELRALAYLFETQGIKANQITENDMDEIGHGLARLIKRQVECLHRAHATLDGL